jgi:hypothetical protein
MRYGPPIKAKLTGEVVQLGPRPERPEPTRADTYFGYWQRGITPAFPVTEAEKRAWYAARDRAREEGLA